MANEKLRESLQAYCEQAGFIIGNSPAMQDLLNAVERVASSDLPVLITGPTGSGKEVVASLLHRLGSPEGSPFLDVNCAAIPEALIESQLFGHEKGAFTGATNRQEGYFSLAANGVLFLDEVAELPLWQQTKLLRVLETRKFRPVGGNVNYQFHGRVVAATHVDLKNSVEESRFREDLYYRLNIVQLHVPSLDERREDIPLLIQTFASRYKKNAIFTPQAIHLLENTQWKGNIRELKNTVDRIMVLSDSDIIDVDDLENFIPALDKQQASIPKLNQLAEELLTLDVPNKLAAVEYAMIQTALQNANGNKSSAARALGVHRKYIERRLNSFEERLSEIKRLDKIATEKMENSQYKEAIEDFRRALYEIESGLLLEDGGDTKFDLLLKLSACVRNVHGWNDSEVISLYEDAQQLTQDLQKPEKFNSVQFGMWVNQLLVLDLDAAFATATEYWREGVKINNPNIIAQAAISIANTHYWMGDYPQTSNSLQNFIDLYNHDQRIVVDMGHDPFIYYLMFKSHVNFQLGKVTQAKEALTNLICYAQEVNQPFSHANALQVGAWVSYKLRDLEACYRFAEEMHKVSIEHGFPFTEGMADIFLGHKMAFNGDYVAGRQRTIQGFKEKLNGGIGRLFNSMYGIILADMGLEAKNYQQGLEDIEATIATSLQCKERCYLAEALVMRGRLKHAMERDKEAVEDFEAALKQAQSIGSKAGELKASYQLANWYYEGNRRSEARRVLTPVVLRYAELGDYYDVEEAKSLMAALTDNSLLSA